MNTNDTKELLSFVFDLADGIKASLDNDSKITIGDAPNMLKAVMSSSAALAGINEIPKELSEMSEDDATEIKQLIMSRFQYAKSTEIDIIYENLILYGIGIARNILRLYKGGLSQSSAA